VKRGLRTSDLHQAFLAPLGPRVICRSDLASKPLDLDLQLPLPPRLRVYLYNLVGGFGTKRPFEYKAVLRVRGQAVGQYGSFAHARDRMTLLVAYRYDLDVFILWDAMMHARFKNGGNIQVRTSTVLEAAARGQATQVRSLSNGSDELVIACQSWNLVQSLEERVNSMGCDTREEWEILQS
jgi:restriction-modification system family protein